MTPTSSLNDAEQERVDEQQTTPQSATIAVGNGMVAQAPAEQQDALTSSTSLQESWGIYYVTEMPGLEEEARIFAALRVRLIAVPPEESGREAYLVDPFSDPPEYPELDAQFPPPPNRVISYRPRVRVGWGEPDPDVLPPPPYAEADPNIIPLVLYLARGYLLRWVFLSASQYATD